MLKINQHTTKLSKALLTAGLLGGAAVATLGAGSAQAAVSESCSFGSDISHPLLCSSFPTLGWTFGDKKLTNLVLGPAFQAGGPPSGTFSFIYDDLGAPGISIEDEYTTLATFDPALPPPNTGSYMYNLAIIQPGWTFKDVELDTMHVGSGTKATKVVQDALGATIASLESIDGMADGPDLISGTFIKVTDSWEINPATGTISSIGNSYTQNVPAPLPLLGVGAALGSIRKLRKFSTRLKTFSMN